LYDAAAPKRSPCWRAIAAASVVLCFNVMGGFIKQTRAGLTEVNGGGVHQNARSKGIREFAVVVKHGFRNALIPSSPRSG
jgi:peptide/nickel transport system permease protein